MRRAVARSRFRLGVLVVLVLVGSIGLSSGAMAMQRESRDLAPLWGRLDRIRNFYRGDFAAREGNSRRRLVNAGQALKSHANVIRDYKVGEVDGRIPRQELPEVLAGFRGFIGSADRLQAAEAVQGFQETLNEIMAGEALVANELLLQGLRSRYPFGGAAPDPPDADQTTLLTRSTEAFRDALKLAGDEIRTRPEGFRAASVVNPGFPFFVENVPTTPSADGELVESEYYRFTDLVNRYGLAANSLGRRKFFFNNVATEGNGGAGRDEAAVEFQNAANAVYLNAVMLAAVQSSTDFQNNFGSELKRNVNDAEQSFSDIRSGFNPLTLRGDFVPFNETNELIRIAGNMVVDAQRDERDVKTLARRYDEDAAALSTELRDQTVRYLSDIEDLIGFVPNTSDGVCQPPDLNNCDLTKPEDRALIEALAEDESYLRSCDDEICKSFRSWRGARIDLREAQTVLFNIVEQVRIEERRSGAITRTISSSGESLSALELTQGIAVAFTPDVAFQVGTEGFNVTTQFALSEITKGAFERDKSRVSTARDVQLEATGSRAVIANLLLQHATQGIAVERASLAVVEARATYTNAIADLRRAMRNFVVARVDLGEAYLTNPAYRLQLELAQQTAEGSFRAAMIAAYNAAKALEYEWAERLENPVRQTRDGAIPIPIGEDPAVFAGIIRAESVFAVRSAGTAGSATPTLHSFMRALDAWDARLRQDRTLERGEGNSVVLSLKNDLLGFDSEDGLFNRLAFRNFIAKHRFPGSNADQPDLIIEFPIQIGDKRLLPALANLKLLTLGRPGQEGGIAPLAGVNLIPAPGRSLRSSASQNPPLVDLVMSDEALIRTFFHNFDEGDDDLLVLDLESARSFRQSPFFAAVEATIDGAGRFIPNNQLANRSPAVSRWVLLIDMGNGDNRTLLLENLDDIEIVITYVAGKPPTFAFPNLPPLPS